MEELLIRINQQRIILQGDGSVENAALKIWQQTIFVILADQKKVVGFNKCSNV